MKDEKWCGDCKFYNKPNTEPLFCTVVKFKDGSPRVTRGDAPACHKFEKRTDGEYREIHAGINGELFITSKGYPKQTGCPLNYYHVYHCLSCTRQHGFYTEIGGDEHMGLPIGERITGERIVARYVKCM